MPLKLSYLKQHCFTVFLGSGIWGQSSMVPLTQVSHEVVGKLMAGTVVSSEISTGEDLLPRFLIWLLVGFNAHRVIGLLRATFPHWLLPRDFP